MPRKWDSMLARTLTPGKARLAGLAAVAAVAGLVIPGAASAATSSSNPAVVHACYAKKGGALRVATHCTSAQRSISWNQTGPKGPAGPKGARGPQGPAGTFGKVSVVDQNNTVPAGYEVEYNVQCPSGDIAISGGASFGPGNGTGLGNVFIETSRPDPVTGTPTGWDVILNNGTSQTATTDTYAVCAQS